MDASTDPVTGEPVYDSPTSWVKRHIDEYVATDGAKGQNWHGAQALLLTTRGRKTGRLRRSALYYGVDRGRYVVVASKGGAPDHPSWFYNLVADPKVRLQVGAEHLTGTARVTTGEERARLWKMMTEHWPDYDDYQEKTDREIPVVVIEV